MMKAPDKEIDMQTTITSPHFSLTEALEEAVHQRFSRLKNHAVQGNRVHVILDKSSPGRHKVRASVQGLSKPISATASHEDMYAAIEKVVGLIDRQWRKRKTAALSRRHTASLRRR